MSEEDSNYTELMTCSKSVDNHIYDVSVPKQDFEANANATLGSLKTTTCSGKSSKLFLAATIVSYVIMIIISAIVVYLIFTTQAGRLSEPSDLSMVQGSGAAVDTTGPPGTYIATYCWWSECSERIERERGHATHSTAK